jgi:regulator of sigma E protease
MMSVLFTGLAFLFVLTIVIVIHELGHYWAARYYGVQVKAFSLGFGPELWHRIDKNGTRWRLAAFPLGGYVKLIDDENAASFPDKASLEKMSAEERAGAFQTKTPWQRAVVFAAGPMANFILALFLYAAIFWVTGERTVAPRVDKVVPQSAAEAAGFKAGDLILSINGDAISSFDDLRRITSAQAGSPMAFVVDRGGAKINLNATPRLTELPDGLGGKMRIGQLGIAPPQVPTEWSEKKYNPIEAVGRGATECYRVASETLKYIGRVVSRKDSGDQIGGPARIAVASGKMANLGIMPLLFFVAFLSVSVGLANLLPIPILDGFHLVMCAIEGIRGYPLAERTQEYAFRFGIVVLGFLFVFANWNDLALFRG